MNVKRESLIHLCVFVLLVLIGVTGRLWQPAWSFTPMAAIAIFAGYYFANRAAAVLVPLTAMVVSDLWLPAYGHAGIMAVVYAALVLPVVIGWSLRRRMSIGRLGLFGFIPAVIFFLTTNLAVWAIEASYPATAGGLLACYAAALPFFRSMLTGDLLYIAVLFGCYGLAVGPATTAIRRDVQAAT
jgi:hypothetical protein